MTTLPITRGYREVRVSVEQGSERGSTSVSSIQPAGASFGASDLVLGTEAGSAAWKHDGTTVPVTPFSTFVTGSDIFIFQELYGLSAGEKYRTIISLRRTGSSNNADRSLDRKLSIAASLLCTRNSAAPAAANTSAFFN